MVYPGAVVVVDRIVGDIQAPLVVGKNTGSGIACAGAAAEVQDAVTRTGARAAHVVVRITQRKGGRRSKRGKRDTGVAILDGVAVELVERVRSAGCCHGDRRIIGCRAVVHGDTNRTVMAVARPGRVVHPVEGDGAVFNRIILATIGIGSLEQAVSVFHGSGCVRVARSVLQVNPVDGHPVAAREAEHAVALGAGGRVSTRISGELRVCAHAALLDRDRVGHGARGGQVDPARQGFRVAGIDVHSNGTGMGTHVDGSDCRAQRGVVSHHGAARSGDCDLSLQALRKDQTQYEGGQCQPATGFPAGLRCQCSKGDEVELVHFHEFKIIRNKNTRL